MHIHIYIYYIHVVFYLDTMTLSILSYLNVFNHFLKSPYCFKPILYILLNLESCAAVSTAASQHEGFKYKHSGQWAPVCVGFRCFFPLTLGVFCINSVLIFGRLVRD